MHGSVHCRGAPLARPLRLWHSRFRFFGNWRRYVSCLTARVPSADTSELVQDPYGTGAVPRTDCISAASKPTCLVVRLNAVRGVVAFVVASAATVTFAFAISASHRGVERLLAELTLIWGWQALFTLACLSLGHVVLTRLLRVEGTPLEILVLSMALGTVGFVMGMYVAGALGWLTPTFAVLYPELLLLSGIPAAVGPLRRAWSRRKQLRPTSPLSIVLIGLGAVGLAFLYLQCLTPESISYDATWTHLAIAEDYAREGRIVPFIADVAKNLPHLSSILYTWCFLVPGFSDPALHWMTAQHLELTLFLWTLAGVVPVVRWLVGGKRLGAAWVTFFLFPGIFVYDNNLGAGSDHIAAFFALPLLLASLRAIPRLSIRYCFLAGALAGAALHTKYQTVYLVGPVSLMLLIRWTMLALRRRRANVSALVPTLPIRRLAYAPMAFAAAALLTLSPHLLRNLIFYHNPVYPLLQNVFTASTPRFADSPFLMKYLFGAAATPITSLWSHLSSSLSLSFTFSLSPQYSFVGKLPVFGSLFTLLIPVLLLFWKDRRLMLGLALGQGALLLWALSYRIDRNLQVVLPWLVAGTAAGIITLWRRLRWARIGVAGLLFVQAAWGASLMLTEGDERTTDSIKLIQRSFKVDNPSDLFASYESRHRALGAALPKDAVLLLHTAHKQLGINRKILSDWAGWQFVIDYRTMRTPRDLYLRLSQLGVTHIAWNNYDYPETKQEDVLFVAFTRWYAERVGLPGGFWLWKMPETAPPEQPPLQVVTVGMNGYKDGLYRIDQLGVFDSLPEPLRHYPAPVQAIGDAASLTRELSQADAVLLSSRGRRDLSSAVYRSHCFVRAVSYYAGYSVLLRSQTADCARHPATLGARH